MIFLPTMLNPLSTAARNARTRSKKTTYKVVFKKRHSRCRKLNKTKCKMEKKCKLTKRTKKTKTYCRPHRNKSLRNLNTRM